MIVKHASKFILFLTMAMPTFLAAVDSASSTQAVSETDLMAGAANLNFFSRAMQTGPIVFVVLIMLFSLSILTWAIVILKWFQLRRVMKQSENFVEKFWETKSLNEFNNRLMHFSYSPVKEVFRQGYTELARATANRDLAKSQDVFLNTSMDNMTRTLNKAKHKEKQLLERFLSLLAISASASPFIGLFGTVWGIMRAFEEIAKQGTSSLAAVAPGISEALIATAFGLAAAIPAVIGYNIFSRLIRNIMLTVDGFSADFLNIVQRYLVFDKTANKTQEQEIRSL